MQPAQISFLELLDGTVQYVVPRWQRRYRWGKSDIERLIDDLLTVAVAGGRAAHYGGTLLTFTEPGPPGVVRTIRVVDGQQRLTTVSILLACIAEKLGTEGAYGEWTVQIIRNDRLTNPGKPPAKHRKLRLQEGDEDEYRLGLEGQPAGSGAVTQAWKIVRRIVAKSDVGQLLEGLQRLRVVGINLDEHEGDVTNSLLGTATLPRSPVAPRRRLGPTRLDQSLPRGGALRTAPGMPSTSQVRW